MPNRDPGWNQLTWDLSSTVHDVDFTLIHPWQFRKYHFSAGVKIYNLFDTGDERDVQNNVASPDYGRFYNPIERSIGFAISTSRP